MTKHDFTLNLVYKVEYWDDEDHEAFFTYHTIFRNVPLSQLNKLNNKDLQAKIKKYCDKNFKETAENATGLTEVEVINADEYYKTYNEVFGEIANGDNALFNDYGQLWNGRQFFKYDYNPELTESYTYKNLNKKMRNLN